MTPIKSVALALAMGLVIGTPALAVAAPQDKPAAAPSADVKAELAKLKKAVGAGEISAKEYRTRKEALLQGTQTAQTSSKPK